MQSALAKCLRGAQSQVPLVLRANTLRCQRHASTTASPVPAIGAAIKELIGDASSTARQAGRRRRCRRHSHPGLGSSSESSKDATQWRTQKRHTLATWLEPKFREGAHKHILVREFVEVVRRFGQLDRSTEGPDAVLIPAEDTDDKPGCANSLVDTAWAHYAKIRAHEDAPILLLQIPLVAIRVLVYELTFLRGAAQYRRRFERVVQIFSDRASVDRAIASPLLFSFYLRALNKLGRFQQAISEAAAYRLSSGSEPESVLSVNIVRQIIEAYFGGGRPDKAMEIFDRARTSPEYCDAITPHLYVSVIGGAMRAKHLTNTELYTIVDDLFGLLEKPSYPDSSRTGLLNELLHVANKAGNRAFLFRVFERSVDRGFSINHTTFGVLLHCSCTEETDARVIYRVYRSLITHSSTYAHMTPHVFAIFINCFVCRHRVDHALSVLHDLRLHPAASLTVQHLSLIFRYYAEYGMSVQALELLHTAMDVDKVVPTWTICVDVIKAVGRGGDLACALETVAAVNSSEAPWDEASRARNHDALLTALVKFGHAGDSVRMLETFFALHESYPQSILPFVAILMQAHHIAKQHSQDLARGPTVQTESLVAKASAAQQRGFVDQLNVVADLLLAASATLKIPQNMYNMAISVFAILRDHSSAQRIYDHMTQTEAMEPTARTFNVLLQSFVRGLDLAAATDVLKDIRARGTPLNRVAANALIHGYLAANQPQQAIDVYAYLVGRPVPLLASATFQDFIASAPIDTYTFAMLVSGLVDAGLLKEAVIVFEDAFTVLPFVPRQLLETLVGKLEERSLLDFAQLCIKRYTKRVEDSQPAHLRFGESGDLDVALPESAPERLPLSYFGFLLGQKARDD
ncbi:hypothetical protein IW152_004714 [Coemansia sp. BCRC 34962]|nr:hypothetical protein IW152_004714 [Coemansia sp. BCRC 34962]